MRMSAVSASDPARWRFIDRDIRADTGHTNGEDGGLRRRRKIHLPPPLPPQRAASGEKPRSWFLGKKKREKE